MKTLNISKNGKFLTLRDDYTTKFNFDVFKHYEQVETIELTISKARQLVTNNDNEVNNIVNLYINAQSLNILSCTVFVDLVHLKHLYLEAPRCRNEPTLYANTKLATIKLIMNNISIMNTTLLITQCKLKKLHLSISVLILPPDIFKESLMNLSELVIDYSMPYNYLSFSINYLQHLHSLKSLKLSRIEFSNAFSFNTKSLRTLWLNQCSIRCLKFLTQLSHLVDLKLISPHLNMITSTFRANANLKHLQIRSNIFCCATNMFGNLENLTHLNLSCCTLYSLESNTFTLSAHWLQFLNLSSNLLRHLDENIFVNCTNLRKLDISDNKILILQPLLFAKQKKLIFLNLEKNCIQMLSHHIFKSLVNLQFLNLSRNHLQFVTNKWFSAHRIYSLETLNLNYNTIQTILKNKFQNFPFLKRLIYKNNDILKVEKFSKMNSLISLDFSFNSIADLRNKTFSNLTGLTNLYLAHNNIKNIPADMFKHLTYLEIVDLSYNKIVIDNDNWFRSNRYLNWVSLKSNLIEEIPQHLFSANYFLTFLDISNNTIANFDLNLFQFNLQLKYIIYNDLIFNPAYNVA